MFGLDAPCTTDSQIVANIEQCMSQIPANEAGAEVLYEELLRRHPEDSSVKVNYAEMLVQSGNEAAKLRAQALLEESVRRLSPEDVDPKSYFFLGQLSDGLTALHYYEKGRDMAADAFSKDSDDLNRTRLIDIMLSIAELFMTDLCDLDEAQAECEKHLNKCLELDDKNFCVRVQRAAYSRILGDLEDAREEATLAFNLLSQFLSDDESPVDDPPGYDTQLHLARLAVDIGMTDEAVQVAEFLLRQDDADDRVYHVLALCYLLTNENDAAMECATCAKQLLSTSDNDPAACEALDDLIETLNQRISNKK